MKYTSHKTKKERGIARKRALLLVASSLAIVLSAVMLMNLEKPSSAKATLKTVPIAQPSNPDIRVPAAPPAVDIKAKGISVSEGDLIVLNTKNLVIPVEGVSASQLRDSFHDARSEGRVHQALDIMAPRDTPVLAANDGAVMKLYQSVRGGTMIYQSDPSGLFVFCYAHLSRYADGILEGKRVKKGDVIAYVGDTGNAGPGNFHLHFGISRMSGPGKWSGGEPIDPYPLLVQKPGSQTITGK